MAYDLGDYRYIYNNPGTQNWAAQPNPAKAQSEFQAYSAYRTIIGGEPSPEDFTGITQIFQSSGGDVAGYSYLTGLKAKKDAQAAADAAAQAAAAQAAAAAAAATTITKIQADSAVTVATVNAEATKTAQTFASSYGFAAPSTTSGGTAPADSSSSPVLPAAPVGQPGGLFPLVLALAALLLL